MDAQPLLVNSVWCPVARSPLVWIAPTARSIPIHSNDRAVFGPKLRRFGRAPPDLAPPPRAATGEFLAPNSDLARPPPRL